MPTIQQQDIETLEILIRNRTSAGYPIQVDSPVGSTTGVCLFDPKASTFQAAYKLLEEGATSEPFLEDFGNRLFKALIPDQIMPFFRSSLEKVRSQGKGLRVRLSIDPPELAVLPWEYLYDREEDNFLAISPETPLIRYPAQPHANIAIRLPLRVLVAIASPSDIVALDLDREKNLITQALEPLHAQGLVEINILEHATIGAIGQAMRGFRPHVFHFAGHGMHQADRAYVVLENDNRLSRFVDEKSFREFFKFPDIRVAILNACQTASISSIRPLVGLAPRLLQRNIAAVIAMQQAIFDDAALIFVRDFYRSLALGYPVDVAITEARKGIFQECGSDRRDWGIPVIFLQAKNGQVFQIQQENEIEIYIFNQALHIQRQIYVKPDLSGRQLYAKVRSALDLQNDVAMLNGLVGLHCEYKLRYNGEYIPEQALLQQLGIVNGASLELEVTIQTFAPGVAQIPIQFRNPQNPGELSVEIKRNLFLQAFGHLLPADDNIQGHRDNLD